jgi:hypothetical protein
MPISDPGCGKHRAYVHMVGTGIMVGEVTDIWQVYWDRRRDDISVARVYAGNGCCELATTLRTVDMELRIWRDNEMVWRGIITRLEFQYDGVEIHAEDMLWVAKRRVVEKGWNNEAFPSGAAPGNTNFATNLLVAECFARYGDFWGMAGNVVAHPHPNDRQVRTAINKYQFTVWQVIDNMARSGGLDYTVVNGIIHLWDVHTRWNVLQDLEADHLSQWPRIVEYGNDYANRFVQTDGSGYGSVAYASAAEVATRGKYVDKLNNSTAEDEEIPDGVPSQNLLNYWQQVADRGVDQLNPPPVVVIVPEGSTLLPSCPWDVNDLIPGSWFRIHVEHACRQMFDDHKLQEVRVTDSEDGEQVQISTMQVTKNFQVNS